MFLALDTLACQIIYNRYPWTLSSREAREGNDLQISAGGITSDTGSISFNSDTLTTIEISTPNTFDVGSIGVRSAL